MRSSSNTLLNALGGGIGFVVLGLVLWRMNDRPEHLLFCVIGVAWFVGHGAVYRRKRAEEERKDP